MKFLPNGKLDSELLARLLGNLPQPPGVLIGPGVGHDVTVIDQGADDLLLATTDPITFATDAVGYYSVAVNANDIATAGGVPRWFLATVLLPSGETTPELVESLFKQITDTCGKVGAFLVGGHTEVTCACSGPVVVGQMLGTVRRDSLVRPDGMQPGDVLLLTKQYPLEGTALIARECREDLLARGYDTEFIDQCAAMLYDPGIMVFADAQAICGVVTPHAMHDPTEGGLATGLWEMAEASGVGLRIEHGCLPLLPQAKRLCEELNLDPLGLIASGSLLAAVPPDRAEVAIAACQASGIPCTAIGVATPPNEGIVLARDGCCTPLPRYDQDEITKVL
jgi:hydrogenase expression/formation protein HypE